MSDGAKIEWTDATWNPITGCSVVSPGCTNCYAMRLAGTRLRDHATRVGLTRETKAGPVWTGDVRFNEKALTDPARWTKPRMIFVCAHGDLFHENVPDEWIDRIFAVMALCPQHTFQVLTKRSARMRRYMEGDMRSAHVAAAAIHMKSAFSLTGWRWPLPNVWLGVSAEDQTRADERIPDLLATPAAVRWVSAEPLLGPLQLDSYLYALAEEHGDGVDSHGLDWIVVGGESGPHARPMHPQWARDIRDQCADADVPFFFKQWGEWGSVAYKVSSGEMVFRQFADFNHWVAKAPTWVQGGICLDANGRRLHNGGDVMRCRDEGRFPVTIMHRVGKKKSGRQLDGVQHDGYPAGIAT